MPTIKEWAKERAKLKKIYEEKGIMTCEIQLPGCWGNNALGFVHRFKRIFYDIKENKHLLGAFNHTLLGCNPCHDRIEDNKKLTENIFKALRDE